MVFSDLTVCTVVSGYEGSQKTPKFEMYVCMFGPETLVNIEQIWFYIPEKLHIVDKYKKPKNT